MFEVGGDGVVIMLMEKEGGLDYLFIINQYNQPVLFKKYEKGAEDLNIQLHAYASLDFLDEKLAEKGTEYLGQIYTIYNLTGEYLIYAFYTATKVKILGVVREVGPSPADEGRMKQFFLRAYRLYKKELYQPFENALQENKFSKRFHLLLDSLVASTSLR